MNSYLILQFGERSCMYRFFCQQLVSTSPDYNGQNKFHTLIVCLFVVGVLFFSSSCFSAVVMGKLCMQKYASKKCVTKMCKKVYLIGSVAAPAYE